MKDTKEYIYSLKRRLISFKNHMSAVGFISHLSGRAKDDRIIEISAFPDSSPETEGKTALFNRIVAAVYESRDLLKKSILNCSVNSYGFVSVTLNLKKVSPALKKRLNLNMLFNGTFPVTRCCYCGCYYLTYHMYTYRDNAGCVGRSYECVSCRSMEKEEVFRIYELSYKQGIEKAKRYQFALL